jgi:hypothetical protein
VHDEHHRVGAVRQARVESVDEAFDGNHGDRLVFDAGRQMNVMIDGMYGARGGGCAGGDGRVVRRQPTLVTADS